MSSHDHTPSPPAADGSSPAAPGSQGILAPRQAPLELSHADMNAAYQAGLSIPFGQTVVWIMRYQDAWWVLYEGGWLRITDSLAVDDLDRLAVQMARADTSAARDTAIRAAIQGPSQPPSPGQSAEQES